MLESKIHLKPIRKRKLTSIDIARLVGVTPSTVSRVLNGAGGFSKQTEQRVLEVVSATGYKPSSAASSLSRQTHETIGLVTEIENDVSYYGPQLMRGVSLALSKSARRLAMDTVHYGSSTADIEALPLFRTRGVDGFIFDVHKTVGNVQLMANRLSVPHVFVNAPHSMPHNAVMPDDVNTAQQATEYLIQRGHRRIGYFPSDVTHSHSSQQNRMKGYLQAMIKAGLQPVPMWDAPLVKKTDRLEPEDYVPRLRQYVDEHGCTAAVTFHAFGAACILSACYQLGYKIPTQLSIIACDYDPILDYTPVKLTSMHLDRAKMGMRAVEMLLRQIEHKVELAPVLMIQGELRESHSVLTLN